MFETRLLFFVVVDLELRGRTVTTATIIIIINPYSCLIRLNISQCPTWGVLRTLNVAELVAMYVNARVDMEMCHGQIQTCPRTETKASRWSQTSVRTDSSQLLNVSFSVLQVCSSVRSVVPSCVTCVCITCIRT